MNDGVEGGGLRLGRRQQLQYC